MTGGHVKEYGPEARSDPQALAMKSAVKAGATALPIVRLKAGAEKRLVRGHPWVYSNEIEMDSTAIKVADIDPSISLAVKNRYRDMCE